MGHALGPARAARRAAVERGRHLARLSDLGGERLVLALPALARALRCVWRQPVRGHRCRRRRDDARGALARDGARGRGVRTGAGDRPHARRAQLRLQSARRTPGLGAVWHQSLHRAGARGVFHERDQPLVGVGAFPRDARRRRAGRGAPRRAHAQSAPRHPRTGQRHRTAAQPPVVPLLRRLRRHGDDAHLSGGATLRLHRAPKRLPARFPRRVCGLLSSRARARHAPAHG
ncbi:MAG: hypothetical protein BWX86_03001 [Verrucomicrobia bacterium ADurb.Bin122]|nr:MAG: hypothetical protein BWX86_03001 [Verrucomicrobia bacterium ADurb.Bin122]